MIAGTLLERSVFVRELLPQDLKIEIEHLSRNEAMEVAEFLARVVGRGHARQMDRRFGSNGWPNLTVIGQSLSTHHPGFGTASWSLWLPMRLPICSTVADTRFPTPPELFQVIGGAAQRSPALPKSWRLSPGRPRAGHYKKARRARPDTGVRRWGLVTRLV